MNIGRDNKKVLDSIKDSIGPASFQKIMVDTNLSHKRVQNSLHSLHSSGGISSGGIGLWVSVRKRPTIGDLSIGSAFIFVIGVVLGYAWHYNAVL
jgi:hypothetical protein